MWRAVPHPGFLLTGFRLYGGNGTPKSETGLNVQLSNFNGVDGNVITPLTVGGQLAWDTWHTPHPGRGPGQRHLGIADGRWEHPGPDRVHAPAQLGPGAEWLRGQLMELINAELVAMPWTDNETSDDVYWDKRLVGD